MFKSGHTSVKKAQNPALLTLLDIYQRTKAVTIEELITTVIPDNTSTMINFLTFIRTNVPPLLFSVSSLLSASSLLLSVSSVPQSVQPPAPK